MIHQCKINECASTPVFYFHVHVTDNIKMEIKETDWEAADMTCVLRTESKG